MSRNNNLTLLNADSPSFSSVEYFLRLSLQASTARIVKGWEINNPQLTIQFEKKSRDLLTLDAWVDVEELGPDNSENEAINRGIKISADEGGMLFKTGKISLAKGKGKQLKKKMILCKVAVGRSYNAEQEFAKVAAIPEGYDSFLVDEGKVEIESAGALQFLKYIVKDSAQILPTFMVEMEFDPVVEEQSRQKSVCENCEKKSAAVFCQADSANLCQDCDKEIHSSKLTCRHVRTPLEEGPQTFSACRLHPDKIVEFFCPTCSKPVCVHCKMVGHHSTGEAAKHKLITVAEAFKGVHENSIGNDPLMAERKRKISQQMQSIQDRAQEIKKNTEKVQENLREIYQRAQEDLEKISRKKMNVLKGDIAELAREQGEIEALESFLEYQRKGGDATQFILDWNLHKKLCSELYSFAHFREVIDVDADIRIDGSIQVCIESASKDGASSQERQANSLFDRPRYMTASTARSRHVMPSLDFSNLTKANRAESISPLVKK